MRRLLLACASPLTACTLLVSTSGLSGEEGGPSDAAADTASAAPADSASADTATEAATPGDTALAPILVGATQAQGSETLDIALPAGTVEGDLLFAALAHDDAQDVVMPSGWQLLGLPRFGSGCNGGDTEVGWAWRRAGPAEQASSRFAWPGSTYKSAAIVAAFRNVDTTSIVDFKSTIVNTTPVSSFTCPSLLASRGDLVLLGAASWVSHETPGWQAPAGMTVVADTGFAVLFWDSNVLGDGLTTRLPLPACGAVGGVAFRR